MASVPDQPTPTTWLQEQMAKANASRMMGNEHFKQGEHASAINLYDIAIACVRRARTSAESIPMGNWTAVQLCGWVHQHFGEAMATKFAENDSITGATLAALSTTADIQLCLLPLLHLPESSNVLFKEELLDLLVSHKNGLNAESYQHTMNHQEAKIYSNRSLANGKLKNHQGAVADAVQAVLLFPEWGKAYYRLGSAQLKLSTLFPDDANLIDQARETFSKGRKLPVSEHTSDNDLIAMDQKVKICTQKLKRYLENLQLEMQAAQQGGGPRAPSTLTRATRGPPPGLPPSKWRNDVSILSYGLKDDVANLARKLNQGSSPNSCNQMGQTALHVAAIWGAMKVGQLLVERGANVNARNQMSGATPLMMAAQRGRVEFARFLIDNGADALMQDDRDMFAYQFARDSTLKGKKDAGRVHQEVVVVAHASQEKSSH